MADPFSFLGESVNANDLKHSRAQAVTRYVGDGRSQFGRLVDLRRDSAAEAVILELDLEVPQQPVFSIRPLELIALRFHPDDRGIPTVLALRPDFPKTPHQNLTIDEYPKSLCLYDQPWSTLKMRWTAARFVERVREWMALTARGELHGEDQPLEPMLLNWESRLVLPSGVFRDLKEGSLVRLFVEVASDKPQGGVLLARALNESPRDTKSARFVATLLKCQPQEHGVIRRTPKSLEDLQSFASAAGLDLKRELQALLKSWREERDIHDARLIILLWLPKTRNAGAPVEDSDLWAFANHLTIRELGELLNAWAVEDKSVLPLLGDALPDADCSEAQISLLNPHWTLTPKSAARANGLGGPVEEKMVAVGAGALGSQVLMNFARCGYGEWTVVDEDLLLPHNLARQALYGFAIGVPKAAAVAHQMRSICQTPTKFIIADVLDPQDGAEELQAAIDGAKCVVDLSASVPVARALARTMPGVARAASLFLNPAGTEVVLLAEDSKRTLRLDHLEHQFYRGILNEPGLATHFEHDRGKTRYAHSCRDISSTLPQHLAALHAAIGSKALRDALSQPGATIKVWKADVDLQVFASAIQPAEVEELNVGGWTVSTDSSFRRRLLELRQAKLPNETGGVLLGSFDLERKIVYLVDTIPSPPDSKEWPTLYIRGAAGLAPAVTRVSERTAGMLQYVGEWHSHPSGVPPLPSGDDCTVFAWLTELMDRDGFPAIMIIASDDCLATYVCNMAQGREPR
jgi:hypothetical protein